MAKRDDDYVVSEYGNWNVASEYSRLKIMKQLYLADEYQTIATFGTVEFIDELNNPVDIDTLKIKGFARLIQTLILVIDNTRFAIRPKLLESSKLMDKRKELERFYKNLHKLYNNRKDVRKGTSTLVLVKLLYEKALERVIDIKADINDPLNKADLIFTFKEEFDYDAFRKKQWEDVVMKG